ncbi:MAG: hypothetical protein VKJ46_07950 [Leptolyngbyaceae bacterium]|nr:hypothetical protein [Leptolyngbyaceae bacterium]
MGWTACLVVCSDPQPVSHGEGLESFIAAAKYDTLCRGNALLAQSIGLSPDFAQGRSPLNPMTRSTLGQPHGGIAPT